MIKSVNKQNYLLFASLVMTLCFSCGSRPDTENNPAPDRPDAAANAHSEAPSGTRAEKEKDPVVTVPATLVETPPVAAPDAAGAAPPVEGIPSLPAIVPTPSPTEPVVIPTPSPAPVEPIVITAPVPAPAEPVIDWANVNEKIFKTNCLPCHKAARAAGGVVLDSYAASKLSLAKIRKAVLVTGTMPPNKPLTDTDKNLLKAWLDADAPETVAR